MTARSAIRLLFVVLMISTATSCAFVFSQEHYRPVERGELPAGVSVSTPTVQVGLIWFVVGAAGAGSFDVPWGDATLEVHGGDIAWGQHWFGPILPIFPFFMGAGTTTAEVDVFVVVRGGAVTLVPGEFLAKATQVAGDGGSVPVEQPPRVCYRDIELHGRKDRELELSKPVRLERGEWIQLRFALPVRKTKEFELTLPPTPDGDARVRLRFYYDNNKYLDWELVPLPWPCISF